MVKGQDTPKSNNAIILQSSGAITKSFRTGSDYSTVDSLGSVPFGHTRALHSAGQTLKTLKFCVLDAILLCFLPLQFSNNNFIIISILLYRALHLQR